VFTKIAYQNFNWELEVQFKQQSACFASTKPWVQTLVLPPHQKRQKKICTFKNRIFFVSKRFWSLRVKPQIIHLLIPISREIVPKKLFTTLKVIKMTIVLWLLDWLACLLACLLGWFIYLFIYLFMVLGLELRVSSLLDRCSTTWATPPTFFCIGYFQDTVSKTILLGWLWTVIPLDLCILIARITGMRDLPKVVVAKDFPSCILLPESLLETLFPAEC
jgi:hypothetical protein